MVGVHNMFEEADAAGVPRSDGGYDFDTYDSWDIVDHFDGIATQADRIRRLPIVAVGSRRDGNCAAVRTDLAM